MSKCGIPIPSSFFIDLWQLLLNIAVTPTFACVSFPMVSKIGRVEPSDSRTVWCALPSLMSLSTGIHNTDTRRVSFLHESVEHAAADYYRL
mmetsp:Transcript_12492/g.25417  ORF Transcript_12492/g.25417 Transcript_12492/m.25417 type:complete len:91 (-) Transcript_12492:737-1009(-)